MVSQEANLHTEACCWFLKDCVVSFRKVKLGKIFYKKLFNVVKFWLGFGEKKTLIMNYKEESVKYNSTGLHNSSEHMYVNISVDDYDDYDYDYDDSVNTLPIKEIVPVAIVYGLTLLLGVIGNGLVIFSISR